MLMVAVFKYFPIQLILVTLSRILCLLGFTTIVLLVFLSNLKLEFYGPHIRKGKIPGNKLKMSWNMLNTSLDCLHSRTITKVDDIACLEYSMHGPKELPDNATEPLSLPEISRFITILYNFL